MSRARDLSTVITEYRGALSLDGAGIDMTGAAPAATAMNTLMTQAATDFLVVETGIGRVNMDATVTLSAPLQGLTHPWISTHGIVMFVPSFSNVATPVLELVGSDGAEVRNVFIGNPSSTGATNVTNAIGLKLGTPGATPETTYKVGRSLVENIKIYGLSTGMLWQGWTNTGKNIHINNCGLGFYGEFLNASVLELKLTGNLQDFRIDNSSGLELNLLWEGDEATAVASTIDNCHAIKIVVGYSEHGTTDRTDYLLKIGSSTEVTGLDMFLTASAVFNLTSGKVPILLDRVNGGRVYVEGSSGSMHGLITTTSNTKNVKIIYTKELGKWPLEGTGSNLQGPAYNHFPNSDFSCWVNGTSFPRGWNVVTISGGVAVTQRNKVSGHDVRRGRYAIRLTASTDKKANRYVEFQIGHTASVAVSPTCLALRGKTILTGAWIWIPNTPEFAESDLGEQHCNVILNTYSLNAASVMVSGSLLNGDYSHHTVRNGWNFLWTETLVQNDCTRIGVSVYLQTAGANPSGLGIGVIADAYIDIDSIQISEATVPFEQFMGGGLPDAPTIDAVCEGGKVRMFTDVAGGNTDSTQYFGVGDVLEKLTPTSGTAWRTVCVTAGVGGTAGRWKTEAVLS